MTAASCISFPPDHLEQFTRGISALTIDPYRNITYYTFPFLSAFFSGHQQLQVNPAQEAMLPNRITVKILNEIQDLTRCAGIRRTVIPYTGLNNQFLSFGGLLSLTSPILLIPDQHLFRRNGIKPFTEEAANHPVGTDWIFTDDETRFFICRELGQIKENSAIIKVAIKISIIAALFAFYTSPFGLPIGAALFIGGLGLYIISERVFQGRADRMGVDILSKKIRNAREVAIGALEKVRKQNLFRRANNNLTKAYITKSGNNILDFIHPYLTTRIGRLET